MNVINKIATLFAERISSINEEFYKEIDKREVTAVITEKEMWQHETIHQAKLYTNNWYIGQKKMMR